MIIWNRKKAGKSRIFEYLYSLKIGKIVVYKNRKCYNLETRCFGFEENRGDI